MNANKLTCVLTLSLSLLLVSSCLFSVRAAVVLNNSRIIMDDTYEKTLQFDNTSDGPFLVQVGGGEAAVSNPDMIAVPPVFQIKGHSGQVVKLKLLKKDLPQDRESLLPFSFVQFPSASQNVSDGNNLNIVIESHLKLIYRPKGISPINGTTESHIFVVRQGNGYAIFNDSKNIATLSNLRAGNKLIIDNVTILPGKYAEVSRITADDTHNLSAGLINDYGMPLSIKIAKQ